MKCRIGIQRPSPVDVEIFHTNFPLLLLNQEWSLNLLSYLKLSDDQVLSLGDEGAELCHTLVLDPRIYSIEIGFKHLRVVPSGSNPIWAAGDSSGLYSFVVRQLIKRGNLFDRAFEIDARYHLVDPDHHDERNWVEGAYNWDTFYRLGHIPG